MNPYLRQDIEEQITEYWRGIHKNKWSIVAQKYEDVTFDLKIGLNSSKAKDGIFYGSREFVLYITFHRGKPSLVYTSYMDDDIPRYSNYPVLQKYIDDMRTRYKYQGR